MRPFDYSNSAELFPTRNLRARRTTVGYKRFARAADAIKFAIEELPPELLHGAHMEVNEERFDSGAIRRLYEDEGYPLPRRPAKFPPAAPKNGAGAAQKNGAAKNGNAAAKAPATPSVKKPVPSRAAEGASAATPKTPAKKARATVD
jgi:hypothetical protein